MSIAERYIDNHTQSAEAEFDQTAGSSSCLSLKRLVRDTIQTGVVTILVFLLTITFVAQGYQVYGSCMEPNLLTGERLLGSKLAYVGHAPGRGDIVVFKCPEDKSKIYIKRVVGLPGEVIEIRCGDVYIDGRRLKESYLIHAPHGDYAASVVKQGHYFVMGDYRDLSNDSRFWGQLPASDVQAKAWVRYWPIARATVLR